jgi:hypothetical protein
LEICCTESLMTFNKMMDILSLDDLQFKQAGTFSSLYSYENSREIGNKITYETNLHDSYLLTRTRGVH